MTLQILGPLEIGGDPAGPHRRMTRLFLGMLALRANTPVRAESVTDGLWGGAPPRSAAANLRSHLADARRLVGTGARIDCGAGGYLLRVDPDALDALRFGELADAGGLALAAGEYGRATWALTRALLLWRGPVLAGLDLPVEARTDADLLEDRRLDVLEDRIQARLGLGQSTGLCIELRGLVARHGLRERLWRQLMLALYRSGRQGEALAAYRQLRWTLDDELGVPPHPDTERLHQQLLRGDPALAYGREPILFWR
jgi:DNA-binding SARP family transcriptional activator